MQCNMRRYKAHRCTYVHAAIPNTTFTELKILALINFGGEAGVHGINKGGFSSLPQILQCLVHIQSIC